MLILVYQNQHCVQFSNADFSILMLVFPYFNITNKLSLIPTTVCLLCSVYYSIPEITLLYAASTILFSIGIHGILLPGNLYGRDQPQDFGTRFCPPSWQLPEKYVEHHGFRSCSHWVRI